MSCYLLQLIPLFSLNERKFWLYAEKCIVKNTKSILFEKKGYMIWPCKMEVISQLVGCPVTTTCISSLKWMVIYKVQRIKQFSNSTNERLLYYKSRDSQSCKVGNLTMCQVSSLPTNYVSFPCLKLNYMLPLILSTYGLFACEGLTN